MSRLQLWLGQDYPSKMEDSRGTGQRHGGSPTCGGAETEERGHEQVKRMGNSQREQEQ